MAIWPQYTADLYYAGETEDYGGPQPSNTANQDDWPEIVPGYVPRKLEGKRGWEQVENHKGETGYVDGKLHTITEYGPYPAGWSTDPPPPTPEEQQAAFTAAIQGHLDGFAQTRNYDGIMSAATYATSTVPKFQSEGQYAVEARDATWAKAYEILDAVLAGERPMPTIEDVIAELPPLAWPENAV